MSAETVWHEQRDAGQRGDWAKVSACFAPDSAWTLMPPGTTFRGPDQIVAFIRSGLDAAAERQAADIRNEFATSEWGVFEYTSRGVIDAAKAAQFADKIGAAGRTAEDLIGTTFEVPVCFIYHVNNTGLIDRVHEYVAAMPALPA